MASELSRTLAISGEEAADKLLNLSPYETKEHNTIPFTERGLYNNFFSVPSTVLDLDFLSLQQPCSKLGTRIIFIAHQCVITLRQKIKRDAFESF